MTSDRSKGLFLGELVRLAAPREEDAAAFAQWSEDADYLRAVDSDYARPMSAQAFAERSNSGQSDANAIEFRLRTVEGDVLIGFVALHGIEWNNGAGLLSIGIGNPDYRGKGYGAEALRLVLRYAFDELNLHRVGLDVIGNNTRAIRAYERVGFRREGVMREAVRRDGVRHDRILMSILRPEWLEKSME